METKDAIKKMVRERYSDIAIQSEKKAGSCGCCSKDTLDYSVLSGDYRTIKGYEPDADLGLGCGLPTKSAFIRPGDTVVDMGSGAGNDCFIAARETGEQGKVIGIDMTPAMIDKARSNAVKLGFGNVEFMLGEIENTPLAAGSADVVVSNCVFNLVPDKSAAFRETLRILKPGGHFSISDIVTDGELPKEFVKDAALYAGCISGALPEEEYLAIVGQTGFQEIRITDKRSVEIPEELFNRHGLMKTINKPGGTGVYSITVFARKPEE